MKLYDRSLFNILKLNSENWESVYDIKAGGNLPATGIGKGLLGTSWWKANIFSQVHCPCKNVKTKARFLFKHVNTYIFVSSPIIKVSCSALILIGCASQAWPYVMLEVTLVRAALPPPSLSRVNQKVMGRATPSLCQGSGNHLQSIHNPEKAWHTLFNSYITKELQLLKMASYIHKFIFPHSSVLKGVNSSPSLSLCFIAFFYFKGFISGQIFFSWLVGWLGECFWFFSLIKILQNYLIA